MRERPSLLTGVAAGLAAGSLWGLVFVAPKVVKEFAPADLTAARFLAFGVLSLGIVLLRRRATARPVSWSHLQAAFGLSLLGFTGFYFLLVLAIRDIGVELPTLIVGAIPVALMLVGRPHDLHWKRLIPGLLLTVAGLCLMAKMPSQQVASQLVFVRGIGFAIVALISWTAFACLNARWLRTHPEVHAAEWSTWIGMASAFGGLAIWTCIGSSVEHLTAQPGFWRFVIVALILGWGSSWLAISLWNVASRTLSTSLCGQLIVSETLFALLYSFAWDGQWPSGMQWGAGILFTLGILASIRAHR